MGVFREKRCFVGGLRGAAAILLTASLLCALAGQAMAAVTEALPSATTTNLPAVTVEGNAVVDSNGQPTGFFELALKVRTKFYFDAANQPVTDPATADPTRTLEHPFRSAAVALRYDAELLTPVTWSYTLENPTVGEIDESTATSKAPVALDTKKPDTGISASAAVEGYTAVDVNNFNRPTALLTMFAESPGNAVTYDAETVVCVVRFKYDPTKLNMDAKGTYPFLRSKGAPQGQDLDNKQACVVWFADDAAAAKSTAGQSVWYHGAKDMTDAAKTYFYYYLNAPTLKADGTPDTAGRHTFIDSAVMPGTKDYTANILDLNKAHTPGGLAFQLVNTTSYANGGVNVDNLATILFYDWDDTLINVLTVEKGDARAAVNAHIEKTMIHPELRASEHPGADYMDSLDRKYTYRGTYPAEGPGGSITVTDGDKYVLTNKLDYSFYKRPSTLTEDTVTNTNYWTVDKASTNAGEEHPYTYGWAVVKDIKNIENVWTTFGVGELADCDPKDAPQSIPTPSTGGPTEYSYKTSAQDGSGYFQLEDFSNLTPGIHYVKACYEEGSSLLSNLFKYTITKFPTYTRYNANDSTNGAAYSIKFSYERMFEQSDGIRGVARMREAAVRLQLTPDLMKHKVDNTSSDSFYQKVDIKNLETIDVDAIVSGGIYSIDYVLVDSYNSNVVEGPQRSTANSSQLEPVPNNFSYTTAANAYDERQGTPGVVFTSTLNVIMEQGSKKAQNESHTFSSHMTLETAKDINLHDKNGSEYNASAFASQMAADTIAQAIQNAWDAHLSGNDEWVTADQNRVDLSYHQLQNYVMTNTLLDDAAADALTFSWCRLHQTCIDSAVGAINDWPSLLEAAKNYDTTPGPLDNIIVGNISGSPFYLSADANGSAYASAAQFIPHITAAVTAAGASYASLTWDQVQYFIIHGAYPSNMPDADAEGVKDYWWYQGGKKVTGWDSLLEAAKKAVSSGRDSALNTAEAQRDAYSYALRADEFGNDFADFSAFKAALSNAIQAAQVAGQASPTWDQIQYHIIHKHDSMYVFPDVAKAETESKAKYFWYNGGGKVTNLATLLLAADLANNGRDAMLNTLTLDLLYDSASTNDLHLRLDFKGTKCVDDADLTVLKNALKALTAAETNYSALTWSQVQYYLVHKVIATGIVANGEANSYYWWKNGGIGLEVDFTAPSNVNAYISAFVDAAYRYHYNGNTNAWGSTFVDTVISDTRLIRDDTDSSITKFALLPKFTTQAELNAFTAGIDNLIVDMIAAAGQSAQPVPAKPVPTWHQVQYYLLGYGLENDTTIQGNTRYWWRDYDEDPASVVMTPEKYYEQLMDKLIGVINGSMSGSDFDAWLTPQLLNELGLTSDGATPFDQDILDGYSGLWEGAIGDVGGYVDGDGKPILTWYQIQILYMEWWLPDPDSAADSILNTYSITPPQWVTDKWPITFSIMDMLPGSIPASEIMCPEISSKPEMPEIPSVENPVVPPEEDVGKKPSAPPQEDTVLPPPESGVGGGVPDAPVTPEVPEPVQPPAEDVEKDSSASPQDDTAANDAPSQPATPAAPPEGEPNEGTVLLCTDAASPIASPDESLVAAREILFISAYQPAALPPPPPRITLYRRTLRRKLISRTAIRGGINR